MVEFFTKLEPTDRFLSIDEAKKIAGLSTEEMDKLISQSLLIALRIKDLFSSIGLELWDGKFEFSFVEENQKREFQLVDSIGPDELRLLGPNGAHCSKEFLRKVYRDSPWYLAAEKAKVLAKERGTKEWKKICVEELGESPKPLPAEALKLACELYPSIVEGLARKMFDRSFYADQSLPVPELCRKIKEYR